MMPWRYFLSAWMLCCVAACGNSSEEELSQWMVNQRKQTAVRVMPLPEPKQFKPETYAQSDAIDPFNKEKLTQVLKKEASKLEGGGALIAPELSRRKEALESFPLDTMSMVGSLVKDGKPVALLKVDNLLYQIQPGSYIGQNYGRVMKITESEITLREIVQDAVGEWVERSAALQLQERSK